MTISPTGATHGLFPLVTLSKAWKPSRPRETQVILEGERTAKTFASGSPTFGAQKSAVKLTSPKAPRKNPHQPAGVCCRYDTVSGNNCTARGGGAFCLGGSLAKWLPCHTNPYMPHHRQHVHQVLGQKSIVVLVRCPGPPRPASILVVAAYLVRFH
jgi:hypothetical protein